MSQIIKNVKGLIYNPSYNPKKEIEKGIILANFDKKDQKKINKIKLNEKFNVENKEFSTEFSDIFQNINFESYIFNIRYRRNILQTKLTSIMKKRFGLIAKESCLINEAFKKYNFI